MSDHQAIGFQARLAADSAVVAGAVDGAGRYNKAETESTTRKRARSKQE